MDEPRADAVAFTLLIGDRPVGESVVGRGKVSGVPGDLQVWRDPHGFVVKPGEGAAVRVAPGAALTVGDPDGPNELLTVRAEPVRQRRFPRFSLTQASLVLPLLALTVTLGLLQIEALLSQIMREDTGGQAAPEPSPELIARLLQGQHAGSERGVLAPEAPRPSEGDPIESYYLQPGHAGPATRIGGGRNIGKKVLDGANKEPVKELVEAPPTPKPPEVEIVEPGADAPTPTVTAEAEEPPEEENEDPEQIAQHMTEGFGFTDWYDTEDARKEAQRIKEELDDARRMLAIDLEDPYALSILAYYEYLAMDYTAARNTYRKITELYPESAAGWNNLALTYKRSGEYKAEEALYRLALELEPNDDHALNNLAVCLGHQGRFDEALAIMEKLEVMTPDDPYADLHRAKIYASMGKEERAYQFLQRSLGAMRKLDSLHNIEFRQDIRVDPSFEEMRKQERFRRLLTRYYGDDPRGWWQKLVK